MATGPVSSTISVSAAAVAAGSDLNTVVGRAPVAGSVTAVRYITPSTLTGANTDSRTVSVINKGAAGSGTTAVATLAFVSGVNATAFVPKTITVSSTAADLVVAAGDVLVFNSLHVGSTGLADPGGRVEIDIAPTYA